MQNSAAMLHCLDPLCQAANSLEHSQCQTCGAPLVRVYLWAVGEASNAYQSGDLIAQRYLVWQDRLMLDTQPAVSPQLSEEIPEALLPYARLFPYRLHVPQIYGCVSSEKGDIWLLESGNFPSTMAPRKGTGAGLLPRLVDAWQAASPLRQLNWLWQMAKLWQPLSSHGVVSTLLDPTLVLVNGTVLQLRELSIDEEEISLTHLGQLWSQWGSGSSSAIEGFLEQVCDRLQTGQLKPEALVAVLDRALYELGRSQRRSYKIVTLTDTGPTRRRNEDAFYQNVSPSAGEADAGSALAIVCDGVGGHEGGQVASQLAIEAVRTHLEEQVLAPYPPAPEQIRSQLEQALLVANDRISEQNDQDGRQGRQRMGTTLVMLLAQAHEVYLAHVGDSRAYWIARSGCYQVTLDDDVASRQVRLGQALYRQALQSPTAGSLVQALGMSPSVSLHPTVQRLPLDEDCVFLLCSDGLSDRDRVEQYWEQEILPILTTGADLKQVGERLVEIANTLNGHDNVTIALVHCRVEPENDFPTVWPQSWESWTVQTAPQPSATQTQPQTVIQKAAKSQNRQLAVFLTAILFALLAGGSSYLFIPPVQQFVDRLLEQSPSQIPPINQFELPPAPSEPTPTDNFKPQPEKKNQP